MHNKRIPTRVVIAMVLVAAFGACTRDPAPRPRSLLIISLDTLRADHLGSYGYARAQTPVLDRLAARGARFEQASTVTPLTLPAHSSLFTGTFPAHHGVRDNGGYYLAEEHETLAEVLAARGLRTGGFVGAFVLDSRWGIGQGFERFYDDFDLTEFDQAPGMDAIQRRGEEVVDQALQWLAEDSERPFFAWVHLYDPHTPYNAPEPYRSLFGGAFGADAEIAGAYDAEIAGAYDAEIAYTDAQVGRLIAALEQDGRLEDTLVVALADHGEMLGEHSEQTHGFFVYQGAIRIPVILAGPGVPRTSIADPVRIVDLMPTVLGLLGHSAPDAVQGADLRPLLDGDNLRLTSQAESWFPRFHYGWSELTAIRDGRYKLIKAPRRELYDLEIDPGELSNLAERESAIADRLEAALERMLIEVSSGAVRAPAEVDPETAERLRALGYLSGSTASRALEESDRPRPDPKDKIALYNLMKEATAAATQDRLGSAIDKIERALDEDPEIVEGHMLLGGFHRKAERFDPAIESFRRALELDPEHKEALYSLALAYKDSGRLDDALAGLERANRLDPRNGKVLWQLADSQLRLGQLESAEKTLLGALELDLDRPRFLVKLGEVYYQQRLFEDAQARLEEALTLNPKLRGAAFTLGLVLEDAGRAEEALAAYRREAELSPQAFRARFNLAKLLTKSPLPDHRREALRRFREVVELQPQFGTGHLYLAKALLDSGDLEAAAEAAHRGLERQPEPAVAPLGHYVLADIYSRLGRPADAAREAAAAERLRSSGDGS